ncbi:hypothetical protein LIER_18614 [Lithospermum erythrorhizon]|uniref:Uncharacterized protein n=1 Tax=Lithospermum erythrorhizon TaxID=34254 RepID=A0AAV3QIT8_LITER
MGVGWVVDECKGVDGLEHGKEGVSSVGESRGLWLVGRAEGELGWVLVGCWGNDRQSVCVGCPGEECVGIGGKWEGSFVEDDVTTNNYFTIDSVITNVATIVGWVAQEHTRSRTGLEFMYSGRRKKGIAETPEHAKETISWLLLVKIMERV